MTVTADALALNAIELIHTAPFIAKTADAVVHTRTAPLARFGVTDADKESK